MSEVRIEGLSDGVAPRDVSVRLYVGVILAPYIFAWFLLRDGYSVKARAIGFSWMLLFCLPAFFIEPQYDPNITSDTEVADSKVTAVSAEQPSVAIPMAKPTPAGLNEAEYIELIDQVIADARKDGLIRDEGDPQTTWLVAVGTIGTLGSIYLEGDKYALSDKGNSKRATYAHSVAELQSKTFPKLRALYGQALGKRVWEHDVEVEIIGAGNKNVRLTGFWFARNHNIKEIFKSLKSDALALRFTRVEFRSHKRDDTTYYELNPLADDQLATFSYNEWTPLK